MCFIIDLLLQTHLYTEKIYISRLRSLHSHTLMRKFRDIFIDLKLKYAY